MPKIKDIINIEKKEYKHKPFMTAAEVTLSIMAGEKIKAYNQGQEELGNESIILDIGEIEKIVNDVVAKYDSASQCTNKSHVASDIAFSIKEQEDKIIIEGI